MSKTTTPAQDNLQLATPDTGTTTVDKYEFEPIKGYPMLNWRGKRPFTATQFYPAQLKEVHGEEVDGWRNKVFWGDNLQVMSHLLKQFRGKVDLIYIDPPFSSKADYKKTIRLKGASLASESTAFEEKQYSDIWTNDEYLQFIYERVALMRELLSETGIIAIHCDFNKVHHIRSILDEVFGESNFVNDITWHYENKPQFGFMKHLPRDHDYILTYAKKFGEHTIRHQQVPVKKVQQQAVVAWDPVLKKRIAKRDENGKIIYETRDEKYMGSVWTIPLVHPIAKERTGYPTQKPEVLLEQLLKVYSNPGDLVMDCFCGSGTTLVASRSLARRFIGADINGGAIQTTTKRLLCEIDEHGLALEGEGKRASTGFEVYNVNHYDVFRNPVQAKELLIEALEIQKLEFSTVFDGEKDGRMVKIMPVNRIATRADLNELIAGFDYKAWDRRKTEAPTRPVEKVTLVCMGHEPDLAAHLVFEAKPYLIDVQVVDILRDKSNLEFKRDSEAKVVIKNGELLVERFYPMNLLQKLSLQKEAASDWRELVESVLIDWNYDGAVLQPAEVDIPGKNELVSGKYKVPADAGTIRVKITDLLSESWEGSIDND
jgi:adenine-specific DNA-methyltransferase